MDWHKRCEDCVYDGVRNDKCDICVNFSNYFRKQKSEPVQKNDNVNHPFYYQQDGRKECIEEILDALGTDGTIHFCIGNVMKYLYRMNDKGSMLKNVLKAEWYCNYANKLDTNGDYAEILCKYGMEIARIKEVIE